MNRLVYQEFVKTARRCRTIEVQAGRQTITAADPSPTTCAKPSAPSTAPADLRTRTAQLRTASISPAPRTDRTQPTPAPGALAAPGPAGLAGIEGKPIRGARPADMIAAPHWPAPDHPVAVPGALPEDLAPGPYKPSRGLTSAGARADASPPSVLIRRSAKDPRSDGRLRVSPDPLRIAPLRRGRGRALSALMAAVSPHRHP